jgi:hypothetical protein
MKSIRELSSSKLQQIVAIKKQIERLESNLDALIGAALPGPLATVHRARRRMSAEARRRISEAAKARWAKFRAAKKK